MPQHALPSVLVLGAMGLLGRRLCPTLRAHGWRVLGQSRASGQALQLDPAQPLALARALREHQPDAVLNLVAATDVDACEADPAWAERGNVLPAQALAQALALSKSRAFVLHLSTDQVYGGQGPHAEDAVRPLNTYARSKLAAEAPILAAGGTVVRTNFIGHSPHPSRQGLSDWLIARMQAARPIEVYDNLLFSPLHQATLCELIHQLLTQRPRGLFNAGSQDGMSKADLAFALARRLKLSTTTLRRSPYRPLPGRAPRPLDMRMDSLRLARTLGWRPPPLDEEIDRIARECHDQAA